MNFKETFREIIMLSRHNEEAVGAKLPQEWLENVRRTVNDSYQGLLTKNNMSLEVYGEIHPGEVAIAFSLIESDDPKGAAITLMTSGDLQEKEDPKSILDQILNSCSEFFDLILTSENEDFFQPNWIQTNFVKNNFYFKITRENIGLSIIANELLKNS